MTVAVGPNFILISIAKDLTSNLKTLDKSVRAKNPNASEIQKEINNFIELHSNAKQLSETHNFCNDSGQNRIGSYRFAFNICLFTG